MGTCGCLEKVLETHREVSKRGNDEDVDGMGGGECHRMLQMTLPWAYIGGGKLLETPGAIYTKTLVGRVWKVLKMPRDVHTSLHYGGRHERSPRPSREF